jgi:TolB protein
LAFTAFHNGYNDGPAGIYLLTPGSEPTVLIDEAGQDCVNLPGSAWNAATDRIAFSSDREGREEIWTIRPDGTGLQRVTHHSDDLYYIEPSFSPDGAWIVFEADLGVPDDRQQGSIWKVRSDGSEVVTLTDGPGGGTDDRQPNWSPAGDRILFQRRIPGSDDWNVYTMAPDGSGVAQVTTGPSEDTDASWSPDGAWIVYSSDEGGLKRPSIFVISASGGEPLRVTSDASAADGAPCWSPDGDWIAFESHEGDEEPASLWRIAAPFVPGECTLICSATVPGCTAPDQEVIFSALATPVNCSGEPAYDWDFGDGSPHANGASTVHAFSASGDFTWTARSSLESATCS